MIKPNKEDKKRFDLIRQIGCIIEVDQQRCGCECAPHHVTGAGVGKKDDHQRTFGLCLWHHTANDFGHCVHNGTQTFEENYGTQEQLLERQNILIEELQNNIIISL